jgi:hypothetical protein
MQLATSNRGAMEAAFLSQEHLQILTWATSVLSNGANEINSDIKQNIMQLAESRPAAQAKAIRKAVQWWEDVAPMVVAARGVLLPSTCSQRRGEGWGVTHSTRPWTSLRSAREL